MNPFSRELDLCRVLAARAGETALRYWGKGIAFESKPDESPVTVADRETERLLARLLERHFPEDGLLGEEGARKDSGNGRRWIIDPIDGTRSFVRGIPLWATLVGLEYKDEQIAGIAAAPALGHTYRALRGDGAYRNDRPIRVSDVNDLSQALVFYSSLSWFVKAGHQETFLDMVRRTDRTRGFGDFYGFVLVAQGSGELMVEHGVHAWDVAAIKPLIEEAGGRFSDWSGSTSIHRPDVIVSNGKLHEEALAILHDR
jgi:histidinol-phosphatase